MAEFEIFGKREWANSYEQDKQMQYAYYSSSGLARSKRRYDTGASEAGIWWERSAFCRLDGYGTFCNVYPNGGAVYLKASAESGICPCFRV